MAVILNGPDEIRLLAAAQAGDGSAFGALLSHCSAHVFRAALRITNNEADAEDVYQESLLNAYRHLCQFRGESRFATWLTTIVTRQAISARRQRASRKEISLDRPSDWEDDQFKLPVLIDPGEDPEAYTSKAELRMLLFRVIDELAPKFRVVIMLREFADLSMDEMSDALGLSLPAAKSRLFQARRRLQQRLLQRLMRNNRRYSWTS